MINRSKAWNVRFHRLMITGIMLIPPILVFAIAADHTSGWVSDVCTVGQVLALMCLVCWVLPKMSEINGLSRGYWIGVKDAAQRVRDTESH